MALLNFIKSGSYSVLTNINYDKHSRHFSCNLSVYENSDKLILLAAIPYKFEGVKDYEDVKGTGTAPPGSPSDGDKWCVLAGATGDWLDQDGHYAIYEVDHWVFVDAVEGQLVKSEADSKYYQKDSSTWTENTDTRPYDYWESDFSPTAISPVDKNIMKQIYEWLKLKSEFSGVTSDE